MQYKGVAFRENSPDSAEFISKSFGEIHYIETQEGISYGAHEMRDGVSLSSFEKQKPLLSASDFLTLSPMQAYVKMPTIKPVVSQVRLDYLDITNPVGSVNAYEPDDEKKEKIKAKMVEDQEIVEGCKREEEKICLHVMNEDTGESCS